MPEEEGGEGGGERVDGDGRGVAKQLWPEWREPPPGVAVAGGAAAADSSAARIAVLDRIALRGDNGDVGAAGAGVGAGAGDGDEGKEDGEEGEDGEEEALGLAPCDEADDAAAAARAPL